MDRKILRCKERVCFRHAWQKNQSLGADNHSRDLFVSLLLRSYKQKWHHAKMEFDSIVDIIDGASIFIGVEVCKGIKAIYNHTYKLDGCYRYLDVLFVKNSLTCWGGGVIRLEMRNLILHGHSIWLIEWRGAEVERIIWCI